MQQPIGMILLSVVGVLIYFGVAHRLLDRMQLTDRTALAFVIALFAGGFFDITLVEGPVELIINVGGGIVPLILVGYLFRKANSARERTRAVVASLVTAVSINVLDRVLPPEPTSNFYLLDPQYLYAIVAGLVGYLAGRSRRSAFIAGTLGIVLNDVWHYASLLVTGAERGRTWIGGAGAYDTVITAGLLAVLLAEFVGESRERLQGGPESGPGRPIGLTRDGADGHLDRPQGRAQGERDRS